MKRIFISIIICILILSIPLNTFALSNEIYTSNSAENEVSTTQIENQTYEAGSFSMVLVAYLANNIENDSDIVLTIRHIASGATVYVTIRAINQHQASVELPYSGRYEIASGYVLGKDAGFEPIEYVQFDASNAFIQVPFCVGDIKKIDNLPTNKGPRINDFGEQIDDNPENVNVRTTIPEQEEIINQKIESSKKNNYVVVVILSLLLICISAILTIFFAKKKKEK